MNAALQCAQRRAVRTGPSVESCADEGQPVRRRRRVFIVDDHQLFVAGLSSLLNHAGDFEVCGAAHREADVVREVRRLRPDLVLLDIKLEHTDGFAVSEALRRKVGPVPIVFLSSQADPKLLQRAIASGALAFLEKTQEPGRILDGIRRALGD